MQHCGGTAPGPASRLRLADLNSHLVCMLCRGYLVDATTIVECLHSFCRSCLVRHLERGVASCPSCEAPLPRARPFLHIRSDKTLQDIVYKLVPGLYGAEMQRRRHFFAKHPEHAALASAEERGVAMERLVFSPDDRFSLSLEYFAPQQSEPNLRGEDWECASSRSSESGLEGGATGEVAGGPARRFLQCPALFTVGLLKKFLRMKFELGPAHRVDVMHRRVCLPDDYTVMDVAYIYSWRQGSPMRFFYRICREEEEETPTVKKRPASEPAATEAPPSKLERINEEEPMEVEASKVPETKTETDKIEVPTPCDTPNNNLSGTPPPQSVTVTPNSVTITPSSVTITSKSVTPNSVTVTPNSVSITPSSVIPTPTSVSITPVSVTITSISSTAKPIDVPETPINLTPTPTSATSSITSTIVESVTSPPMTLSTTSTIPTPASATSTPPKVTPLPLNTSKPSVSKSPRSITPDPRSITPDPISQTPKSEGTLTLSVTLPSPPTSQAMDLSPPLTVPTSPSKGSRPRSVSSGRGGQAAPSILSIAQNLARKQQARQQQEQQGASKPPGSSPQETKPHEQKETKDKYKPIQPRPPPVEIRPSPTPSQQQQLHQQKLQQKQQLQQQQMQYHQIQQQQMQIQQQQLHQQQQEQYYQKLQQVSQNQKRSLAISQQKSPQDNNVKIKQQQQQQQQQQVPVSDKQHKVLKDDIKKPKHEDILRQTLSKSHSKSPSKQSSARTRPSPTYINTPSPFAPMHRPAPHPLRIPAPPKQQQQQQQRPSSLSSSSSPSPSPPADGSPRGHHPLQFSENAAAAAAMMVRQQLELQSRLHLHGATQMEWPLHPHSFLPPADWLHAGSAESMKRLEGLMRSLGRGVPMFPYRPVGPNPAAAAAAAANVAHAQSGAK